MLSVAIVAGSGGRKPTLRGGGMCQIPPPYLNLQPNSLRLLLSPGPASPCLICEAGWLRGPESGTRETCHADPQRNGDATSLVPALLKAISGRDESRVVPWYSSSRALASAVSWPKRRRVSMSSRCVWRNRSDRATLRMADFITGGLNCHAGTHAAGCRAELDQTFNASASPRCRSQSLAATRQ